MWLSNFRDFISHFPALLLSQGCWADQHLIGFLLRLEASHNRPPHSIPTKGSVSGQDQGHQLNWFISGLVSPPSPKDYLIIWLPQTSQRNLVLQQMKWNSQWGRTMLYRVSTRIIGRRLLIVCQLCRNIWLIPCLVGWLVAIRGKMMGWHGTEGPARRTVPPIHFHTLP